MTVLRLWNWAGGGIPVGVWPLLLAGVGWPFFIYRVIKPIGVFRDRSPLPVTLIGWLCLMILHGVARHAMTPAPRDALLVWPPGEDALKGASASFCRLEEAMRPVQATEGLRWQGDPVRLLVTQHLLGPDRPLPASAKEAQSFMEALDLRLLLSALPTTSPPRMVLWRLDWGQCTLEDEEAIAVPGGVPEQERALRRLAERNFPDLAPGPEAWKEELGALYGAVEDSASLWLKLPTGDLPAAAFLRRGSLMLALEGATAQVAPVVERAIALAQENTAPGAEPWVLAGEWFARAGQWEEARQALSNALSVEPAHPLIYWQLGHLAPSRMKEFGFANRAEAYAACNDRQPAFLPAVMALSRELSLLRKSGEALPVVDRALACYPRHAELWLLRGNLCWEILDHEGARLAWEESARLRPEDHRAWQNLGQLMVGQRRFREAVAPLERAVALGSPPLALHLLGLAHAELGEVDKARAYLKRRLDAGGSLDELSSTRRLLTRVDRATTTP